MGEKNTNTGAKYCELNSMAEKTRHKSIQGDVSIFISTPSPSSRRRSTSLARQRSRSLTEEDTNRLSIRRQTGKVANNT